ncbi:proton-coupled folate transporter-like [Cimex lectularius]|uniref:Adenylate cyclase n=1 Tax=Cimex lectularius TaxID=79782 RepID=A0A8I6S299_CIMLE|nr:proton-coupled folate transporter-like [Cimex lectularius]
MVEKKANISDLGFLEKVKYVYANMSVEPMVAWYIIGSVVASLATQNLNLEKACRVNLKFEDDVCRALERRETGNYTKEEAAVQQLVASMAIWKTLVQSAIPAVLILFFGSWSDRRGRRKPCMLLPITGEFLTAIGLIACTYFFYELPMEVAGINEALFPALTGGWMTMFMAIFSYVGDITSLETRTLRIGIVNVCASISVPIGTAVSGILYKQIGYYGVFSLSAAIYILSFGYGYYQIREDPKKPEDAKSEKSRLEEPAVKPGFFNFLKDFFDLHHIKETIVVAFKEGDNNRKKRVMLLMIVVMVVMGPLHGEMTVMYLFTRYRFNWNEVDFSIFSTYSMITNLIGTAISVGVFSHFLKIDDALIGVMSCMSKILAGFVYAFATSTWVFYLAPLVDIVNGTSFIAMRSIISKLVPPDELGKINSVFGLAEAIVPVVYGPLYSAVYRATMDTVPGAFFLLGGGLTAPAVLIFLWMYTEHKKDAQKAAFDAESAPIKQVATNNCDVLTVPQKKGVNGFENKGFEQDTYHSKL